MADDAVDGPLESLLQRHPELTSVHDALAQDKNREAVTARCLYCDALLVVTHVIGAVVVGCPCKRTFVRYRVATPQP